MSFKICFPFVGDSIGGSHVSSLNLIKNLKKLGFNIKIVVHQKGIYFDYLKKNKIDFDFLKINNLAGQDPNFFKVLFFSLKNFFKISKYIKQNKFDIIHGNDLRVNLNWSFASIGKSKYIWHQRNFINKESLLFIPLLLFSSKIIVISKTVYQCLPLALKKKSKVIYNPIDKIKLKNIKINNKINVAYIGKPKFLKGFDIFLKVCEGMKSDKNFHFNVYGSNFKKTRKTFLVRGFTKIEKIINQNDILIAPSRKEGFGRSVIEFAMSRKKVIASNIKAHKEINDNFANIILIDNSSKNYIDHLKNIKKTKIYVKKENLKKLDSKYHLKQVLKVYKNIK